MWSVQQGRKSVPDLLRQTISATEAPGLFNVSPYVTRWMLWQKFAKGVDISSPADSRMRWGSLLQPLIIQQAAQDLKFEVIPNEGDVYHRRGLLGCTRDATIICPDRGPGALETKCVFDYRTWMADWDGGNVAPRHYEIQLQQQMLVGDAEPYEWGILAAWVAGEVHYFERKPIPELWSRLEEEAQAFFGSVADGMEPDPFGVPIEVEWLTKLFPTERGKVVDLSDDAGALLHAEIARTYVAAKEQENAGKRTAEPLRAQLLALAKDAEQVWLPGAIKVSIGGNEKSKRLKVFIPEVSQTENLLMAG
jgi:predicted phage-related endonuclease